MSATETVNARIQSTFLGYEDHGIMTAMLHLDYGGSSQGFGGYALDVYNGKKRVASRACGVFVAGVLLVTESSSWEKLAGKIVRVVRDVGAGGGIIAIGHPLKDLWFNARAEFQVLKDE